MTWTFVGSATDPANRTLETILFFFATEPDAVLTMMDDLDENTIGHAERRRMEDYVARDEIQHLRAVLLGHDRLAGDQQEGRRPD